MGAPSLFRLAAASVAAVVTNRIAGGFSDAALAAVTVAGRVVGILQSVMLGYGQGFQPVAGFSWGAQQNDRVRKGFWFTAATGVVSMAALSGALYCFAANLVALFNREGSGEVVRLGALALRFQLTAMPVVAWVITVNMLFAGIGRAFGAVVLSLARQGFCYLPMLYLLPAFFGANGLAMAQAAADALSLAVALPLAVKVLRELSPRAESSRPG